MSTSDIQAVKSRLNIADVVRRYVDLKPVSGRWMGPCPFHQETKPSFSVNDAEGFFYCFGCQESGDIIDFYMKINGLDFRDALEQLAAEAGVELGNSAPNPQAERQRKRKKIYLDAHDLARSFFRRHLSSGAGAIAREYLERRGISDETAEKFQLGFSPDDWHGLDNHLRSKGIAPDVGAECGLLSKNEKGNIYDRFRGRLIFPIQDLSGRVIAFGGRILTDGEPKYLNSSDSPIYKKGDHLYGLSQARPAMNRTKRALLTEGYMDVLSLHQFGYEDSCGVLGTALTPDQVKRLAGFASNIDLVFDGDNAGRKAALKSSGMILAQGVSCRVVLLPEGEDVDSLLQQRGCEGFDACLKAAPGGLHFCLETIKSGFSPKERMDWITRFIGNIGDLGIRAHYLSEIGRNLGLAGVSEQDFRLAVEAKTRHKAPRTDARQGQAAQPVGKDDKQDRYFLKFPIQYPEYVPELARRGLGSMLSTPWAQKMWEKITANHGQDILPWLDEHEKRFWAACRQQRRETFLSEEELVNEWKHICALIDGSRRQSSREQLMEKLRRAQSCGDNETITQCLQALSESLGRDDEQH